MLYLREQIPQGEHQKRWVHNSEPSLKSISLITYLHKYVRHFFFPAVQQKQKQPKKESFQTVKTLYYRKGLLCADFVACPSNRKLHFRRVIVRPWSGNVPGVPKPWKLQQDDRWRIRWIMDHTERFWSCQVLGAHQSANQEAYDQTGYFETIWRLAFWNIGKLFMHYKLMHYFTQPFSWLSPANSQLYASAFSFWTQQGIADHIWWGYPTTSNTYKW